MKLNPTADQQLDPIVVRAEDYRADEPDPELAENPMALVFPAPQSDEKIYDVLERRPKPRPADFSALPLALRLEWLDRLDEFHHPFQAELDVIHKAVSLLRKGMRPRNPKHPKVMAAILKIASGVRAQLPRLSTTGGGGGLGLLLTGPSGIGKSSLIDRLVEYLVPRARVHLSLAGRPCRWTQLGVIRISVQASWSATLDEVLRAIDQQLGTDFYSKRERTSSNPRLLEAARSALTSHLAPLLILDEFQRLGKIPKDRARAIINGLIDIMEQEGIPVIVVGTVAVRQLFEQFPAELSKFSNGGDVEFERLSEGDEDTANFIEALQEQHISTVAPTYSEGFIHHLMLRTMGVRRIMREYMKVIFRRHAHDETLVIDAALLDAIAAGELRKFERALDQLRKFELGFSLNFHDVEAYEDFIPAEPRRRTSRSLDQQVAFTRQNNDDDSAPMSLAQFVRFRTEQRQAPADETPRAAAPPPAPSEACAAPKSGGAIKARTAAKAAASPARLKQKDREKVVNISRARRGRNATKPADEPRDPSEIR